MNPNDERIKRGFEKTDKAVDGLFQRKGKDIRDIPRGLDNKTDHAESQGWITKDTASKIKRVRKVADENAHEKPPDATDASDEDADEVERLSKEIEDEIAKSA